MKKSICSIMLSALLIICVAPSVFAEWTSTTTVRVVWNYANAHGYVFLNGEDCKFGKYKYFIISKEAAKQEQLMSMLLAAFLAGKKTKIGYSTSDENCRVTSVQLSH